METATLIWEEITQNENGFPEREPREIEAYAEEKSVIRQEAYEAMRAGVEVKIILSIRMEDWERTRHIVEGKAEYARKVIYDEAEYNILRCYKRGKAAVEITCG